MLFINIKILYKYILLNMLKNAIIFNCVRDLYEYTSLLVKIHKQNIYEILK